MRGIQRSSIKAAAAKKAGTGVRESLGFGVAAALLLAGVFLTVFFFRVGDLDVWWHLATGRLICAEHAIPRTDPFSWVIAGKPWLDFEWLAQIVLYACYSAGGIGGLLLYKGAMAALLFGAILALARQSKAPEWIVFPVLMAGFFVLREYLVERPQLFTFWLLAMEWLIVARHRRGFSGIWLLPVLFLIWSNVHGGACLAGLALPLALLAWRAVDGKRLPPAVRLDPRMDEQCWKRLVVATLLSVAATFATPHGYRIYTHAVATVSDAGSKSITEWLPPEPKVLAGPVGAFLTMTVLALWLASRRDPVEWLLTLVFLAMAATARRHIPLFTIVAMCAVVGSFREPSRPAWSIPRTAAIWLGVPIAFLLFLRLDPFRDRIGWGTVEMPQGAADFVLREKLKGRPFNEYDFGGYLIWRLWPEWKVFIDGRNLEYGAEHVLMVWHWYRPQTWRLIQEKFAPDFAVVGQAAVYQCRVLDEDPDWALLHWDDTSLLYARRGRGNDAIIDRTRYRWLKPNSTDYSYLFSLLQDESKRGEVLAEIERSPGMNAMMMRGMVYKELGRWPEAISAYEKAHQMQDAQSGPCTALGIAYQKLGQAELARKWYLEALDRSPPDAMAWSNLGVLEHTRGDVAAARAAWRRALGIDPGLESARANLRQTEN